MASCAAKGSMGRVTSPGAGSPAAAAAAMAALVATRTTGVGAVAMLPGSVGSVTAEPFAFVKSAVSMVRYR